MSENVRTRVIEGLTTHRHGEKKVACRWCAQFYGDIYDRIQLLSGDPDE